MDGQMKKGVLELCVLGIISNRQTYGYEIARQIHDCLPEVQESTVYAVLRRLRAEGALACEYRTGAGGPQRKYYRLTAAGSDTLAQQLQAWRRLSDAVEALCAARYEIRQIPRA